MGLEPEMDDVSANPTNELQNRTSLHFDYIKCVLCSHNAIIKCMILPSQTSFVCTPHSSGKNKQGDHSSR